MRSEALRKDIFRAVSDPSRRKMLEMLLRSDRTVRELQRPFGISQPGASQHLRVLSDVRLVLVRREGRHRYYALNAAPLAKITRWIKRLQSGGDSTRRPRPARG